MFFIHMAYAFIIVQTKIEFGNAICNTCAELNCEQYD